MNRFARLILLSLLATGCADSLPTDIGDVAVARDLEAHRLGHASGRITVMTRNVYIGANVDNVLAGTPEEIPQRVSQAFQEFLSTDFATRMSMIALEIARTRPHLVGLQEISFVRAQFLTGATQEFNFLRVLMRALAAHRLDYRVVAQVRNTNLTLPADPAVVLGLVGVELLDMDVVLARGDVEVSNVFEQNYRARVPVPGTSFEVIRGFAAVDAKVGRRSYRFVTTHLEPAPLPPLLGIQRLQALQLVRVLSEEGLPVILTGDFNTPAHLGPVPGLTYHDFLSAGYTDVWTQRPRGHAGPGFTCCHDLGLRNPRPDFDQRIDLIFTRNPSDVRHKAPVRAIVVGDEQRIRRRFGLWPSDHGGVVARLQVPVPPDVRVH